MDHCPLALLRTDTRTVTDPHRRTRTNTDARAGDSWQSSQSGLGVLAVHSWRPWRLGGPFLAALALLAVHSWRPWRLGGLFLAALALLPVHSWQPWRLGGPFLAALASWRSIPGGLGVLAVHSWRPWRLGGPFLAAQSLLAVADWSPLHENGLFTFVSGKEH